VTCKDTEKVLALLELICIRSGVYQLNDFPVSDVNVLMDSL